jgi:hypothetical protein
MYIGHVGAALAAKRVRTSIGLFALLVATYTPDWVDSALCLAGLYNPERLISHTVPAVVLFALVGFALYGLKTRDWTAALVLAGVILSHMVLDWITGYKPIWPGLGFHRRGCGDRHRRGAVWADAPPTPAAMDRHIDHARRAAHAPTWNRHCAHDDDVAAQMLMRPLNCKLQLQLNGCELSVAEFLADSSLRPDRNGGFHTATACASIPQSEVRASCTDAWQLRYCQLAPVQLHFAVDFPCRALLHTFGNHRRATR